MPRERALNLVVTASATVLVAVIVATAIAGALTRRSSSASNDHPQLVRVVDRHHRLHHAYRVLRKVVRSPGSASRRSDELVIVRSDSG